MKLPNHIVVLSPFGISVSIIYPFETNHKKNSLLSSWSDLSPIPVDILESIRYKLENSKARIPSTISVQSTSNGQTFEYPTALIFICEDQKSISSPAHPSSIYPSQLVLDTLLQSVYANPIKPAIIPSSSKRGRKPAAVVNQPKFLPALTIPEEVTDREFWFNALANADRDIEVALLESGNYEGILVFGDSETDSPMMLDNSETTNLEDTGER